MSKASYGLFAGIYDLFMVPQEALGLRRQRARLCGPATGTVLEIAAGTGLNLAHYQAASSVVAVDNNPAMLRRAIRRAWEAKQPVKLVAADAHGLPFPDESFDSVVIALSLCTIPEPQRVLDEMARVARPAAQLHFLEHVRATRPSVARRQDRFAGMWAKVSGGCRINQDTQSLIEQSSWSIERLWTSDSGGMIQGTATRSQ